MMALKEDLRVTGSDALKRLFEVGFNPGKPDGE